MHHFTPSLQSLPGKWIAFEPLSILIKLPLLRGVRIVKCLIRPVNYNTAHCFSLFNYPHFHWLKQPSSHLGLVRPKLTRETKGWPPNRGQHAPSANAGPGRPSESFPPARDSISQELEWEVCAHARMKDGDAAWFSTSLANTLTKSPTP